MWFMIPSAAAMAAKLALLWFARRNLASHANFMFLLGALFILNALEFVSYFIPKILVSEFTWMMQLYYLAGAVASAAILDICLRIALPKSTEWRKANLILAITVCALTVVPGLVIADVEPMGSFVRRISGPAMPIYFAYVVPVLILAFSLMVYGTRKAPNKHLARQSAALLLGVAPLLLCTSVVLVLMQFGVRVNGAVSFSSLTTLFVVVLFISESRYGLFRLLSYVPTTSEYRARRNLYGMVDQLHKTVSDPNKQSNLSDNIRQMESLSIALAIEANDGNLSKTARKMGVSRTTILRKRPQKSTTLV